MHEKRVRLFFVCVLLAAVSLFGYISAKDSGGSSFIRVELEEIHVRLADVSYVERDLLLIRIHTSADKRPEVVELVNLFRGRVVDVARSSIIVELAGPEEKLEAFVDLVRSYGIQELARTGVIAMQRGQGQKAT